MVGFNIEELEGAHQETSLDAQDAEQAYRRFLETLVARIEADSPARLSVRELDALLQLLLSPAQDEIENQQTTPGAILSMDAAGRLSTFSPELLGFRNQNRLRIARAERLALSTVNEASQALLSLPVWDLGGAPTDVDNNFDEVELEEVSADGDECLKALIAKELEWPADALVQRRVSSKRDGLPERRLYFNADPERPSEVVFASLAGDRGPKDCSFVTVFGEAPG